MAAGAAASRTLASFDRYIIHLHLTVLLAKSQSASFCDLKAFGSTKPAIAKSPLDAATVLTGV
jgi:hypothetical protein